MRSIRLSLVVYFLGLLAVALAVTGVVVYGTMQAALRARQAAMANLLEAKFQNGKRAEYARLDDALLAQARGLARRTQVQTYPTRLWHREYHVFGAITAQATPNGFALLPLWLAQAVHGPVSFDLFRRNLAQLKLPESDLLFPVEESTGHYYQIDSNYWSRPLRAETLGKRQFPDLHGFAAEALVHWELDDYPLDPGKVVRRVRLKVASARRVVVWPKPPNPPSPRTPPPKPPTNGGGRPPGPPPGPPPGSWGRRFEYPPLALYVQCAADTARRDEAVAALRADRDGELAALADETAATLVRQRNRLLAVSAGTFTAVVLGTLWLVWLGLLPLRRLGDAVSAVSPRDFRLPFDDRRLPAELRPIVERLTGTLKLLERAFAREKQATADLSHELRTPLAALLTTIDLALRKPRTPEQYREMLADCRASATQVNEIVERLLTLARLDAGVDRLRPQPVQVDELVDQCATVVRPLAEARGLALTVTHHVDPPEAAQLTTDPDKFREVLNNLLHNAIEYNRPSGRIDLTLGRHNGRLQVEVRDTGIGIPADARDRIFERFFRADPSRNGDGLHAGLGLAIVKEYVELMGGRISVESEEGRGSTFRLELPRQTPAA